MSNPNEADASALRWASVELPAPLEPRPEISHVLFDFDGTLSLIRQGWPEVMVPMFVEALPRLPGETDEQIEQLVLDDIMRLNGKQTIYQMIQLVERIQERGGEASRAAVVQARISAAAGGAHWCTHSRAQERRDRRRFSFWCTQRARYSSTCTIAGCSFIWPVEPTNRP